MVYHLRYNSTALYTWCITHVRDIDVVEQQRRDADVGGDDEENEDEDAEEPALLDHDRVGRGRLVATSAFRHPLAAGTAKRSINFINTVALQIFPYNTLFWNNFQSKKIHLHQIF